MNYKEAHIILRINDAIELFNRYSTTERADVRAVMASHLVDLAQELLKETKDQAEMNKLRAEVACVLEPRRLA